MRNKEKEKEKGNKDKEKKSGRIGFTINGGSLKELVEEEIFVFLCGRRS